MSGDTLQQHQTPAALKGTCFTAAGVAKKAMPKIVTES